MWWNQFKFLIFGNIKRVFRRSAFKAIFFLKIKKDFNENWYFMSQIFIRVLDPPPTCINVTQTLGIFDMWVTLKINRPSFCVILKFSHWLDGLFSVLSRLDDWKHKCTFCWSITERDYFQRLLLEILSKMEPIIYFQM